LSGVHQKGWFSAVIRFVLGLSIGGIVGLALCGPHHEGPGEPVLIPFLWEVVAASAIGGGVLSVALGDRFLMWFSKPPD